MSDTAPLFRLLAIFLGLLILGNLVLAALTFAFPDLPVPSSMGIVLAMVAAMSAGQSGAKATGRRLTPREKAVFAVLATLLSALIGVGLVWTIFLYHGVPFTMENIILAGTGEAVPVAEFGSILMWIVPVVLILYVAVTYLGATLGARNQIKLQEKLAAKGK